MVQTIILLLSPMYSIRAEDLWPHLHNMKANILVEEFYKHVNFKSTVTPS